MQIDIAVFRQLKHPRRNDASVSHDQDRLRMNSLQFRPQFFVVFDLVRLKDGQAKFLSDLLDWRCDQFKSASLGPIGRGHYKPHAEPCSDEPLQRGDSESWGSAKDQIGGLNHREFESYLCGPLCPLW